MFYAGNDLETAGKTRLAALVFSRYMVHLTSWLSEVDEDLAIDLQRIQQLVDRFTAEAQHEVTDHLCVHVQTDHLPNSCHVSYTWEVEHESKPLLLFDHA